MPTRVVSASSYRQAQQPFERRRGTVETRRLAQAQIFQVYGRVEFQGAGETTFEANFPVWFVDPPQLSFGGELGGNQALEAGNYPWVSVMVRRWGTFVKGGHTYYRSAEFVLVIGGPESMQGTAHWQCEGVGLANPIAGDDSLENPI